MSIIEFISKHLLVDKNQVKKFVSTCPYRYKVYEIPKRNKKGTRTIAQPSKELKYLQKLILKNFLVDLPVHDSAMAYQKNRGIRDNVLNHIEKKYFLKMDFKDFFPSIKPIDLIKHSKKHLKIELDETDIFAIERIFFFVRKRGDGLELSIGAPSSPFISNSIMFEFDSYVNDICDKKKITYTRYADDLCFSTNKKGILFQFPSVICQTLSQLNYPRLNLNNEKTVFLSKKHNIHITGLVITPDKRISIGRSKKRYIKSLVFRYLNKVINIEEKNYLSGYLAFCKSVEPSFIVSLEKKYGKEAIDSLFRMESD